MLATGAGMEVISETQRRRLCRDGFVVIRDALSPAALERTGAAVERIYREECEAGRVAVGEPMHLLGQIGREEALVELVDHPAVFPVLWGELGWNIHMHHCHLDFTPGRPQHTGRARWWWHQDGGRQNLELDGEPRPRLSLKVAYWLSDLTSTGRGNMLVIPGSHERNSLPRPSPSDFDFEPPEGALPVLAPAGDAMVFDRRLWHSRSENLSGSPRKAVFLAYTYRWIRPRDQLGIDHADPRLIRLTPVQRQLLGASAGPHSYWGLDRTSVPLYQELAARGLLDQRIPCQR